MAKNSFIAKWFRFRGIFVEQARVRHPPKSNSSQDPMGQLLSESKPASSTSNRPSSASCSCDEELSKLKMEEVLQQQSHFGHVSVGETLEMWVPRTISAHTERTLGGDVCHVIMITDLRAFVRQNDHVKPHTTSRKRSERPSCDGQLSEKYYFSSSSRRIWPWRHNMARQRKAGLPQSSTKVLYKKTSCPRIHWQKSR